MPTTHNLGFPRIGAQRELKFALEAYWKGQTGINDLLAEGARLRRQNWSDQRSLSFVPVGDFSFYDHVLDASLLLGNLPQRVANRPGRQLDNYFRIARGRSANDSGCGSVHAGELTKWFNTNYHYIVPEVDAETRFELNAESLLAQLLEAGNQGIAAKPVILGPLTYLRLSKAKDGASSLDLLDRLLPVYRELLQQLSERGIEWVQIDEPILVTDLEVAWQQAFEKAYGHLQHSRPKLLLTTYFGELGDNLSLACRLPVAGLHLDAVSARHEVKAVLASLPADRVLSLGVIDGRNVWKTDLSATLDWLEPVYRILQQRLWLAPSCSLLHVPVDLASEEKLDPEIRNWLAFARQKLQELNWLARALESGRAAISQVLTDNAAAVSSRKHSSRVHNTGVKQAVAAITEDMAQRPGRHGRRSVEQQRRLRLPPFPTTTIGSFPQTREIRQARRQSRRGALSPDAYRERMRAEIAHAIRVQEGLGLDVLVHGEAERNDMVEYFGEHLEGYAFSEYGWVQSYGSRCVKPPVLFGDISRPAPMTVDWITYAQSLTDKPVKGMLTGPVTMLNWSFVRDDQPRSETCRQLALAIRREVLDLEQAGVRIIQIDEAALREGLPLRRSQWRDYLDWAVHAFRLCASGVRDETQIHTHMCYSEFREILSAIARMDADVITLETSRSNTELLKVFDEFRYPNQIGPGVYDIHSPNIPAVQQMVDLMKEAALRIPPERLWVNPDCGLKTRQWHEVMPALRNLVAAARRLRLEVPSTGRQSGPRTKPVPV